MPIRTVKALVFSAFLGAALTACVNLGPNALDKDQLAYGNSIGENWKNQMLANLVKMRYVDMPEDAYAAYQYEGYWYWIDHVDLQSKEVFTLMLFLTTLTNRSGMENAPVLTIPTS